MSTIHQWERSGEIPIREGLRCIYWCCRRCGRVWGARHYMFDPEPTGPDPTKRHWTPYGEIQWSLECPVK